MDRTTKFQLGDEYDPNLSVGAKASYEDLISWGWRPDEVGGLTAKNDPDIKLVLHKGVWRPVRFD